MERFYLAGNTLGTIEPKVARERGWLKETLEQWTTEIGMVHCVDE